MKLGEHVIYLSSWDGPNKPPSIPRVPTVLSAFKENNRGQIVDVSGYILSNGISNVLANIVLPKISAEESPWLPQISVVDDFGDSSHQAASQNLVNRLRVSLVGDYVRK